MEETKSISSTGTVGEIRQSVTDKDTSEPHDKPPSIASVASEHSISTKSNDSFFKDVDEALRLRKEIKVIHNKEDVTPKFIKTDDCKQEFLALKVEMEDFLKTIGSKPVASRGTVTIDRPSLLDGITIHDIVHGISDALFLLNEHPTQSSSQETNSEAGGLGEKEDKVSPFIKINLKQTRDILLYEQRSKTVPFGTEEAERVEKENKAYEYITKGKGRLRRKTDSETQTTSVLFKTRSANTDTTTKANAASYVSTYEMFDTYEKINAVKSSLKLDDSKSLEVTTYQVGGVDQYQKIVRLPQFQFAQLVIQRILAGNVFYNQQRRFRNMDMPDSLSPSVEYLYRINNLWTLYPMPEDMDRFAVSCMSWCPSNGDILAVGYGIFTCVLHFSPDRGYVCIWSMKNPVNPEKVYFFDTPVVSVEFSPFRPQLLAVGFFDGSVQVRDITLDSLKCTVAVSDPDTTLGYQPILDIKWIRQDAGEISDIEPFLTVSQDGSVMKYQIINSPHLLGYCHAVFNRVEGTLEGIPVQRPLNTLDAIRQPQLLGITLDPLVEDVFHVISNEGVIYKCSTNYPQQHLNLWQTHDGAACSMEFSPWSPKVFLTSGDDWCIRIWIDGIFKPLITLWDRYSPINSACWSKTHSTIIVSVHRKTVDVWDIKRSTLKPMTATRLERSYNTLVKFSNCGRSIAVGNERGAVHVIALEDMPFPPHFQYEALEKAIFDELKSDPDLLSEVKNLGYFGYPKRKY